MDILSLIKRALIFGGIIVASHTFIYGQNKLAEEYLKGAGDFAQIYNGELEENYNPFLYLNDPYFISKDYVTGELVYKGITYPNQRMRLDMYRERLVLLVPKINLGILVNPVHIDEIHMYDRTVIYHIPSQESGLRMGYYVLLYDGQELKLLERLTASIDNVTGRVEKQFKKYYRFYLIKGDVYHSVKSRQSFMKLFPEYKKQIKRYAKENELNFKEDRENSLAKLAKFCEQMNQSR